MSTYTTLVKSIAFFKDPEKEVYKKAFLFQRIEDLPFNPMYCAVNAGLNFKIGGEEICLTCRYSQWFKEAISCSPHYDYVQYVLWTEIAFSNKPEYERAKGIITTHEEWSMRDFEGFCKDWWKL